MCLFSGSLQKKSDKNITKVTLISPRSQEGGVHVGNSGVDLQIFGESCTFFNSSSAPIHVDKFTRLNATLNATNEFDFSLCLFDEYNPDSCGIEQCYTTNTTGLLSIDIGNVLNGKNVFIKFLSFAQTFAGRDSSEPLEVSDFNFWQAPNAVSSEEKEIPATTVMIDYISVYI